MTFFFDNNLPEKLAQAMDLLENEEKVIHLKDKFPHNATDEDWLKYVGENKMIVITRDKKIKKRPSELRAFKSYKVRAFILGGKNPKIWQIIKQIINHWEEIKEISNNNKRGPYAYKVPLRGKIARINL